MVERGVESLFGGSKRVGCDYSLVDAILVVRQDGKAVRTTAEAGLRLASILGEAARESAGS